MHISMIPRGETGKAIHISQDDTNREVEFIPYDQRGLVALTDGQLTAKINSIKGNTISFNQLVLQKTSSGSASQNSVTVSWGTDGSFSFSGTATADTTFTLIADISPILNTTHKYFLKGSVTGITIRIPYASANDTGSGAIFTVSTVTSEVRFIVANGTNTSGLVVRPQIFDLTLMGIDNLTTTAQVEEWLSTHLGNIPYFDYGYRLISFNGTGLKTVGFNQWDEEWEHGVLDASTGTILNTSIGFSSKNFIQVFPETVYYMKHPYYASMRTRYYDANKNYIGTQDFNGQVGVPQLGGTFKIPTNCYYFKFSTQDTYREYQNNICVNLSSSENGKYEPYTSSTINLPTLTYFPTGMKSAGSVYDELLPNKATTRIGSVDLGSLDWTYDSTYTRFYTSGVTNLLKPTNNATPINAIVSGFVAYSNDSAWNGSKNKSIFASQTPVFYMVDHSFTNATTFKNAMSGVYLYYELATPIETDISPALDLTYPIENGGTEQILPENTSTPITTPIIANITYPDRTEDVEFLYKQTTFQWVAKSWSFVCRNITQALSVVSNKLKGTIPSGMTNASGKYDLKVKMTDNDGICYSEKIDLFVEKKP